MIRNNPGQSSYWQGEYRKYGRYQWNVKYYAFQSEFEIEAAQEYFLNPDQLKEVIGRTIKYSLEGRSDGWLAIHTELTERELKRVDTYVSNCMKRELPRFLTEYRQENGE